MKKQYRGYLTGIVMCFVLFFTALFVTAALTDGRDICDFTANDKIVFTVFLTATALLIAATILLLAIYSKKRAADGDNPKQPELTEDNKRKITRGVIAFVVTLIVITAAIAAGAACAKAWDAFGGLSVYLLFGSIIFIVISVIFNVAARKIYVSSLNKMKINEIHDYLTKHRESADITTKKEIGTLSAVRTLTRIYSVLIASAALCVAFSSAGAGAAETGTGFFLGAFLVFLSVVSRIRITDYKQIFRENKTYVEKSDYTALYALAEKARDALHCKGNIKIAILNDCNAGIAHLGDIYSVQIGAVLFDIMSDDELYAVLLHEFSHVSEKNKRINSLRCYSNSESYRIKTLATFFSNYVFCFLDAVFAFHFMILDYSASISYETDADRAMTEHGSVESAAGAMIKLNYYNIYAYEELEDIDYSYYENEKAGDDIVRRDIAKFRKSIKARADFWNELSEHEIISRSTTHPTLKMRLDASGAAGYKISEGEKSTELAAECKKAAVFIDNLMWEQNKENYDKSREEYYLKPKKRLEEWELAGAPVVASEYSDIYYALRSVGRYSDAEALCDRAINELPDAASHFALFMKGQRLLHRYDSAGVELIYKAIDNNSNYIDEGLSAIGQFMCLTGNRTGLDEYRIKAEELAQKEHDDYSKISVLEKNDNLSAESLPDGMLDDILGYIHSVDSQPPVIESIYLVHKTINEELSTSAFIIRFEDKTEEQRNDIMQKIFNYLDTCSDRQFSLFYYDSVKKASIEKIQGSLVYQKSPDNG